MDLGNALKSFFDGEDRAVSPVIGVILMVAITVILAAVIGTFVLGLGDRVSEASPNANFGFDYSESAANEGTIEITHDGGDGVEYEQVEVKVDGTSAWQGGDGFQNAFDNVDSKEGGWDSKITAGDTITIAESGDGDIENGYTVKVIWTASGSDKTAVIGESEVNV
jgi:flagellin-like protein